MLATLADPKQMPRGEGWEFEIKWDGYRIVARVAGGEAELRTRKDQDYTERFANVAKELAKALKTPDCVVDGEVCALDERGAAELLGDAAGEGRARRSSTTSSTCSRWTASR